MITYERTFDEIIYTVHKEREIKYEFDFDKSEVVEKLYDHKTVMARLKIPMKEVVFLGLNQGHMEMYEAQLIFTPEYIKEHTVETEDDDKLKELHEDMMFKLSLENKIMDSERI